MRRRIVPKALLGVLVVLTVGAAAWGAAMTPARGPSHRRPPGPPPSTVPTPVPPTASSSTAPTSPKPPNPPAAGPLAVDGPAWAGHGNLAFVSRGQLQILDDSGALSAVTGPPAGGYDSSPSWSPDGLWLAFLHTAPGQEFSVPAPTLWLVARGTTTAREVTSDPIGMYAWSPVATELAFTVAESDNVTVPAAETVDFDVPGAAPAAVSVGTGNGVGAIAWSPDGAQLAFSDLVDAQPATATTPFVPATSRLGVLSAGSGPARIAYTATNSCFDLAGWWPLGGGLLFWTDPQCSASIEADGVPLQSLASGGARPTTLVTSLVGPQWLAPQRSGNAVAVVGGGGRSIWSSGRDVTVCTFPAATCTPLPAGPGTETLAPAWTASGSLLFVEASTASPFGQGPADWGEGYMAEWDATNTMWGRTPDGTTGRLAGAPAGAVLAVPSAATSSVLYVAGDELWLGDSGAATPAVMVAGPLYSVTAPSGYYGEVDWQGTFAWSQASPARQLSARLVDEALGTPGDAPVP